MKIPMNAFSDTIEALLRSDGRKATKFLNASTTVKATRLHKPRKNGRGHTIVVTFGAPNYAEREFIKACKKAGEPLPVKRVQLKHWPKK